MSIISASRNLLHSWRHKKQFQIVFCFLYASKKLPKFKNELNHDLRPELQNNHLNIRGLKILKRIDKEKNEFRLSTSCFWASILFCGIFVSGCTDKENNSSEVIIGTSADNFPYEYINENGEIIGVEISIVKELMKKINKEAVIKNIEFNSLIPSLNSGHIEIAAASMNKTPEREMVVDFSVPFLISKNALIFLKNKHDYSHLEAQLDSLSASENQNSNEVVSHNSVKDSSKSYDTDIQAIKNKMNNLIGEAIQGKIIGVQSDTVWHKYLLILKQKFDFQIKAIPSNLFLMEELKNERIDFMVSEKFKTSSIKNSNLGYLAMPLGNNSMHLAMPKNYKHKDAINNAISEMIKSGDIKKIIELHVEDLKNAKKLKDKATEHKVKKIIETETKIEDSNKDLDIQDLIDENLIEEDINDNKIKRRKLEE